MNPAASHDVTLLLQKAAAGDADAANDLLPLVYEELRGMARRQLAKGGPANTLQPTALVHEAYLSLVKGGDPGWNGRGHFFGAAANAMRHILIDQARRKKAVKHGGGRAREELADADLPIALNVPDMLALDEALRELEAADERQGRVVMLRFFAGLSAEETAEALGVSLATVNREWRFARSFLHTRLKGFDLAAEGR
ncbi:MAG: extracytoplasmic sigma factor ECF [Phycisphaerae bacterium]|nr:MAG: extracytoplasmic sigma factor ECF [Phycisphaerae bacterium]